MSAQQKINKMITDLFAIKQRMPSHVLSATCGRKNILGTPLPQTVGEDINTAVLALGRIADAMAIKEQPPQIK